ncbi:MAG: DUF1858 domain-containing protein [bacterium]
MITRETKVENILREFPEKIPIFVQMGLPCFVCGERFWGTIEELCQRYDIEPETLSKELNRINKGV